MGGLPKTLVVQIIFVDTVKSHEVSFKIMIPNVCGPQRTPEAYDSAINDLTSEDGEVDKGIKVNSVFNALKSFHVCQPGLPPCLGHDIFEGILSYDVSLYLNYFIKKKKWFTYTLLNRRITQFNYKGSDALTKPCTVNDGSKLSGQAIQNWNFFELTACFNW